MRICADESINAGVGRGQRIRRDSGNRRGIIEAHVHPVDTEVGAHPPSQR